MFRFGTFQFDDATGELWKDGVRLRLEQQPALALTILLARAGEIVDRDELRRQIWGADTHVDFDRGIAYCVAQVRSALGDSGANPRFVETLPKRGFRFIAPVERPPAPQTSPLPAARFTPRRVAVVAIAAALVAVAVWAVRSYAVPPRPVVAVAIFDNETGSATYDALAATAADVVVQRLTALGPSALGVVGNASSLRQPRDRRDLAAIRDQTGAEAIVLGQLQNDPGGLRLIVHLIRLDDDTHLWVTRIVRPPSELMGIDDAAAERLVEAVRLHLVERRADAPRFTR